ncbi:phage tail protein [Georgenia wangjunii]|uniref:phage tail protein n=1 Tax=Georgenia wangjunii TaxID=3117730 RepID=UPI002F26A607
MRGVVPGLVSPVPVAQRMPAVYQEDDFLQRFVRAFDDALAPVFLSLDGLAGYVDPALAPPDFLDWLAEWVGIEVDESWSVERRRHIVAGAADLHRRRGTVQGVVDAVRLAVGGRVEVTDNGGSAWSPVSGGAVPGAPDPWLHVRVAVPDPSTVDRRRLEAVVAGVKPAHVPHTIDVVEDNDADLH